MKKHLVISFTKKKEVLQRKINQLLLNPKNLLYTLLLIMLSNDAF